MAVRRRGLKPGHPGRRTRRFVPARAAARGTGCGLAKFTEEGSITVSLKPVDEGVERSVTDTGPDIPSEDLPHIIR